MGLPSEVTTFVDCDGVSTLSSPGRLLKKATELLTVVPVKATAGTTKPAASTPQRALTTKNPRTLKRAAPRVSFGLSLSSMALQLNGVKRVSRIRPAHTSFQRPSALEGIPAGFDQAPPTFTWNSSGGILEPLLSLQFHARKKT